MAEAQPATEELLQKIPPPEWVVEMHEHYAETGSFRTEDILRVLGDPTKGVDMPSDDASALDALRQAGQDAGV